ncbi:MAG: hypothetical protein ABSF96_14860 [Steroidobacteraceae bacterium]|jgi:nitrous oxide reductase accessory protein NosL
MPARSCSLRLALGLLLAALFHRERQDAPYPVHKEDTTIGGVHVMVFTPLEGPSAKSRNR